MTFSSIEIEVYSLSLLLLRLYIRLSLISKLILVGIKDVIKDSFTSFLTRFLSSHSLVIILVYNISLRKPSISYL